MLFTGTGNVSVPENPFLRVGQRVGSPASGNAFVGAGHPHPNPTNRFTGMGEGVTRPWKWNSSPHQFEFEIFGFLPAVFQN